MSVVKQVLTFTEDGAQKISFGRPSNVVIEGGFGGGTLTHSMTGTTSAIRTPATAADNYQCLVYGSTFTLVGATNPTLTVTLEPVKD